MEKLRIGVIGLGSVAGYHLDAYQKNPHVEIAALCDSNPALLARRGAQYGVAALYEDYRDMLAKERLDAVSICTWNGAHAPCAMAALESGAHVLCEKPMARNAREAESMLQAARRSGKLLMIGLVRRFSRDSMLLKEAIDRGDLGELYHAKATFLRRSGSPGGWFGDSVRAGGGPLIDLGVHVIDLARYLMGNPRPVSVYGATFYKLGARGAQRPPADYIAQSAAPEDPFNVEDFATAMIRYEGGIVVNVDASYSLHIEQDRNAVELFGTKGGARLSPNLSMWYEWQGQMARLALDTPAEESLPMLFVSEINHFIACVREGVPCRSPAEDGLMIMRILDAIYESAREGHEVLL